MLFVGWLFLISGIISAFLVPVLGIPSIVIGVLLLSLGRKRKSQLMHFDLTKRRK